MNQSRSDLPNLSTTLSRVLLALVIIIGSGFVFVVAFRVLFKPPEESKTHQVEPEKEVKLPTDVPKYRGASLQSDKMSAEEVRQLTYIFPLGSLDSIRTYYYNELLKRGWTRYATTDKLLFFYKDDGRRQIRIIFKYYAGKSEMIMELIENSKSSPTD